MRFDRSNVGMQEVGWTVPAALAFLLTLLMIGWAWNSFAAIRHGVLHSPGVYRAWGPRWNFALWLLAAMICFGIGWLGYFFVGVIAMLTPPPIAQANQTSAAWFAWLFIGMESTHAFAQGFLWTALRSLAGVPILPRWRR